MNNSYLWNSEKGLWVDCSEIPVDDRGLSYGDGLFETIRMHRDGSIPLWKYHRQRLMEGLLALDFPVQALPLIDAAMVSLPKSSAGKLMVTRGSGPRGYLPPSTGDIRLIWQCFDAPEWAFKRQPDGFCCEFSPVKLGFQPLLAGIKHLNRLEQVLCRQRMPEDNHEAIMLDAEDWVVEGCMSNLYLINGTEISTPDLSRSGINGVVRRWLCEAEIVNARAVEVEQLLNSDAVFMSNSLNGIIQVRSIGPKRYDPHPDINRLQQRLQELFE